MGSIDTPKQGLKAEDIMGSMMPPEAEQLKEYKKINKGQSFDVERERELKKGFSVVSKRSNTKVFAKLEAEIEDSIKPWDWEAGANAITRKEQRLVKNRLVECDYRVIMGRKPGQFIYLKSPDVKVYPPISEMVNDNLNSPKKIKSVATAIKVIKAAKARMKGDPKTAIIDTVWFTSGKVASKEELGGGDTVMIIADHNDRDEQRKPKVKVFIGNYREA